MSRASFDFDVISDPLPRRVPRPDAGGTTDADSRLVPAPTGTSRDIPSTPVREVEHPR